MLRDVTITAHAIREYDITYSLQLDEKNPDLVEWLEKRNLTFDELKDIDHWRLMELWELSDLYFAEVDVSEGDGEETITSFDLEISQ